MADSPCAPPVAVKTFERIVRAAVSRVAGSVTVTFCRDDKLLTLPSGAREISRNSPSSAWPDAPPFPANWMALCPANVACCSERPSSR